MPEVDIYLEDGAEIAVKRDVTTLKDNLEASFPEKEKLQELLSEKCLIPGIRPVGMAHCTCVYPQSFVRLLPPLDLSFWNQLLCPTAILLLMQCLPQI